MIPVEDYKNISKKYGYVASWAIWEKVGDKPKSNIDNMDIFDEKKNRDLINLLKVNVVMVGLNFSREVEFEKPFMNFHDSNPYGNDFKIRYAFENTPFYGAYMTDIIKNLPMKSSKDVLLYLKKNPKEIAKQVDSFRDEIAFIGAKTPIILAFGKDTYKILIEYLDKSEYSKLVQIIHYSHQINKEKYRIDTHKKLHGILNFVSSST